MTRDYLAIICIDFDKSFLYTDENDVKYPEIMTDNSYQIRDPSFGHIYTIYDEYLYVIHADYNDWESVNILLLSHFKNFVDKYFSGSHLKLVVLVD
jgi:hypothetical protein